MPNCPSEWLRGAVFAVALRLRIAGTPVPKPSVQTSRGGHTYYPASYTAWRKAALEQLAEQKPAAIIEHPVTVALDVIRTRPKTSRLTHPQGDVDNFSKSVLDAITRAGVWDDDTLVRTEIVRKRWGLPGEPEGIDIWIAPAVN